MQTSPVAPAPGNPGLPACCKAYDIRGRVPEELDADLARRIGLAFAEYLLTAGDRAAGAELNRQVVMGHDIRLSSPELAAAVKQGLEQGGTRVVELGLCGTEEVYFATAHLQALGGIMITASHNPADYNGMKLVREQARPVSGDNGLHRIVARAVALSGGRSGANPPPARPAPPQVDPAIRAAYLEHLLTYIEPDQLKPLTIVANPGNGGAGAILDLLAGRLPCRLIRLQWEPDGRFPHGVPNPLLPESREITAAAVRRHRADFGLAWDGDFDRCFFFAEDGKFIEGYYLVGLLAQTLLARHPGGRIIHDPRLVWNTVELVAAAGGIPLVSKTGHAFIKERMRAEDAIYGGEMSAHHYFRDFCYCDSGMIPWLLVWQLLSTSGQSLGRLVADRQQAYPVSGEINRRVADPQAVIAKLDRWCDHFPGQRDYTDGLSFSSTNFRLNIRSSNTEPLLRLNLETRGDARLLAQLTAEVLQLMAEDNAGPNPER